MLTYALTENTTTRTKTWRLNESLLQDEEVLKDVSTELDNYFKTNTTPDSDPGIVWEAHKAVIRGVLIKHGARIKREHTRQITSLLHDLHLAEARHKHAQTATGESELLQLRTKITDLMQFRAKASLQVCRRVTYESGNKCGKLLANSLREQTMANYIPHITLPSGQKVSHPQKIASAFREFHSITCKHHPHHHCR